MSEEAKRGYHGEHITQEERNRAATSNIGLDRSDIAIETDPPSEREMRISQKSAEVAQELWQLRMDNAELPQDVLTQHMMRRVVAMKDAGELE